MKSYILEFTKSDLDNNLRTPIIDLYENDQYINYSVRRSEYGSDLIGTGVYTGTNPISATQSEVGEVVNVNNATPSLGKRFVDTTSRIDIIAWQISIEFDGDILEEPVPTLGVYHSKNSVAQATPDFGSSANSDWAYQLEIRQDDPIYIINANQFVFFELDFDRPLGDIDFTFQVLVEIDPPTVNGFFDGTSRIIDKFPSWMDISEYDPQDLTHSELATPSSLAGAFVNAMAGEWITDIAAKMDYQQAQYYIDSVDIQQKAWVYRAVAVPNNLISVKGNNIELARTANLHEFYSAEDSDYAMFWNRNNNEIYTITDYGSIYIDGVEFPLVPYHVWNSLDEIGATVDLFRIYLEGNENYQKRIKDVYINKPSVSLEGFKTALRRELDLWRVEGATPDSTYLGATPEVLEMADIERHTDFFESTGIPKYRFRSLVDELAAKYPVTWGFFVYNKAFWDPDGIKREGFGFIPKQFDVDPLPEKYLDSGVGDINDAYLFEPKPDDGVVDFTTGLKIRGRQKTNRSEYGPLTFDVAVYGRADVDIYANPPFVGGFTIEITTNTATPTTYYAHVTAIHQSDVNVSLATPSSPAFIEWTTAGGTTNVSYPFYNKATGQLYFTSEDDNLVRKTSLTNVGSVTIKPGYWDPVSQTYTNVPTSSEYRLWFSHNPSSWMGQGGSGTLTNGSFDVLNSPSSFYVQSTMTSHSVVTDAFTSAKQMYTIRVNGANPPTSTVNYTLPVPDFVFPVGSSNPEIVVELMTSWDNVTFGAQGDTDAATPIFLPSTYIQANGNSTWTSGKYKTFSTSTENIVFSSGTGAAYPYSVPIWTVFEANQIVPYTGKVDINGPYRDGEPLPNRNTDYVAARYTNLTRNHFGIPNTQNYILTWIGVGDTNSDDVIAWLDTNTIKPAVNYGGETTELEYPATAIQETLNGGVYEFSPFVLNARLRPGYNKKWNPRIHSGYIYDSDEEYYIYAQPKSYTSATPTVVLSDMIRQGAPVIVHGNATPSNKVYDMRQVSGFGMVNDATPVLSSVYKEHVYGTGTNKLYAAYSDIYNITVRDTSSATPISVAYSAVANNLIVLNQDTDFDHEYELTYRIKKSYYVDNNYVASDGNRKARIVFDQPPASVGYVSYGISTEAKIYDPSTPIDLPLNTMYTSFDEGFIYIDHDVHPLDRIEASFSPTRIIANGNDYGQLTIRAYDEFGNPKPNQTIQLYTSFGTLSASSVKTNSDGYASVFLTSEVWDGTWNPSPATPALPVPNSGNGWTGTIYGKVVGNTKDTRVNFSIDIPVVKGYNIYGTTASDAIVADGSSAASIYGKVENASHQPAANARVTWRKGRSIYEALGVAARRKPEFYFDFDGGLNTNSLTVPDAANLDLTGDMEFVLRCSGAWSQVVPSGQVSRFLSKGLNYDIFRNQTAPAFISFTAAGASFNSTISLSSLLTDNVPYWIKVTFDVDNGSSQSEVRFYYAADAETEPSSWTQIGDPRTNAIISPVGNTDALNVGNYPSLPRSFYGKIYRTIVRNGIGGTTVLDIKGTDPTSVSNTTFTASTGQTVTVNKGIIYPTIIYPITNSATPSNTFSSGWTTTDSNGRFTVEPFTSSTQPGYWFVALESDSFTPATPAGFKLVGDVVSWYEYPNVNAGVEPITNLAVANNQDATPTDLLPSYNNGNVFPVTMDEEDYEGTAFQATPQWIPPAWYAIGKYRQYQMGLSAVDYYDIGATPVHPDYKEF